MDLPRCKYLCYFFFVSYTARAGVWLLFNGLLALVFSLFTSSVSLTGFYAEDEPVRLS